MDNQNEEDMVRKVKAAIDNKDNYVKYTKRAYQSLEEICLGKNIEEWI